MLLPKTSYFQATGLQCPIVLSFISKIGGYAFRCAGFVYCCVQIICHQAQEALDVGKRQRLFGTGKTHEDLLTIRFFQRAAFLPEQLRRQISAS